MRRAICLLLHVTLAGFICLAQEHLPASDPPKAPINRPPGSNLITFDAPGAGGGPFEGTFALTINSTNDVTGSYLDAGNVAHGLIRTSNGTITEFDAPGAGKASGQGTFAISINDGRSIAGFYTDNQQENHSFVRDPSGVITTFDPPGTTHACNGRTGSAATGINASGVITGTYCSNVDPFQLGYVRTSNGAITPFAVTGGQYCCYTYPMSVNATGTIAGTYYDLDDGLYHGFIRATTGAITVFEVPGAGGEGDSEGTAPVSIDSAGDIAGSYTDSNSITHGFVRSANGKITTFDAPGAAKYGWAGGKVQDLPFMQGTFGFVTNDAGVTTATYADPNGGIHGALRAASGIVTLFDVPGAGEGFLEGTLAAGINPAGMVTGAYNDDSQVLHGFILNTSLSYLLSVSKSGSGSGTVTSDDGHINCGATCSYSYLGGTSVTLTAKPVQGSALAGWNGCDQVQGYVCVVTMNSARNVTATFSPGYLLSVSTVGNGSITSGDDLINCGAVCSAYFAVGSTVTLTAKPAQGFAFSAWSGCDQTRANVCTVAMNSPRGVTAYFLPTYALSVSKTGSGTVSSVDGHINCGSICSYSYIQGAQATLSAIPAPGYTFKSWAGCNNVNGSYCSVTMSSAKNVTASFRHSPTSHSLP